MSKILCREGEMMWDNCIAKAVQVFTCKDTVCQYGLHVTCLTHGNSVLHPKCKKLMETWELCVWLRCSLGCDYVRGQTQAHFAWTRSCLAARVCVAVSATVLCWLIGHVGRQAVQPGRKAVLTQVLGWKMALLQPAGSRHRTHNFPGRFTLLLMICCCRDDLCTPCSCSQIM